MASEPGTPQDQPRGLSRKARFLYWLALYLIGYLATLSAMWQPGTLSSVGGWLGCLAVLFLYAPFGLFNATMFFAGDPTDKITQWIVGLTCLAFFSSHLILSLIFRSKIKSTILMAIMVAALTLSWIGFIKVDGWRMTRNGGFHTITHP